MNGGKVQTALFLTKFWVALWEEFALNAKEGELSHILHFYTFLNFTIQLLNLWDTEGYVPRYCEE